MSSDPLTRPTGRDGLPSLTSLRFFAAAFVVGYHLVRLIGPVTPASYFFWYGRSGVTFFFVLSGVVLAWTYYRNMPALRVFWWRRFARIWPLLVTATAISVALYLAVGSPVSAQEVIRALLLIHAWSFDPQIVRGGNGATWSLSDEAFFYLCFPLILAALSRSIRPARQALAILVSTTLALIAIWLLLGLLVDSASTRVLVMDYFPPTRILQFVVGVAFGVALARGWRPKVSLKFGVLLFLTYDVLMFGWMRLIPEGDPLGAYSASQLFSVPVYLVIVLAAVRRDLSGRSGWLANKWLVRLGHWSFAWYLIHAVVIRAVIAVIGTPSGLWQRLAIWVFVAVVSLACAAALYHVVEHPAERYLRGRVKPGPIRGAGSALSKAWVN